MDTPPITELAYKLALLAQALGVPPLNQLPGPWRYRIDAQWEVAVNGWQETVNVPMTDDCMGAELPPFHMAVWYNGFLAGLMTPFQGVIAAGEGANEDTLIAAIDAALSGLTAREAA